MNFGRMLSSNISLKSIRKGFPKNHLTHSSPYTIENNKKKEIGNKTDAAHLNNLSEKINKTYVIECTKCWNKGKYLTMGEELCDNCGGSGIKYKSDSGSEPCEICNGNGKIIDCYFKVCEYCLDPKKYV